MAFLTLTDIRKDYGAISAVTDFSLQVEKGEFVSLLGPSGCGKTTTLHMIAGFVPVTQGRIQLDGRDITHTKPNSRGLGIVFQSYALFPHMTVAENVGFGLEMQKVAKAERATRINEALSLVHLEQYAARYPRELSGGQRQRVALARAIVIRPPILLLDEPLSNLDAKLREEMQFELRGIQRKLGTTTIMVTHDQAEAFSISDRVVVMESGRITQVDAPYRIYEHPRTRFISHFVGKTNLLEARAAQPGPGGRAVVDGRSFALDLPAQLSADAAITLAIRPEKLRLVGRNAGRLDGRITSRYFLGSQWLYHLDTSLGQLLAVLPNDGVMPREEGETVGVDWADSAVRLLTDEDVAA